MSIVLPTRRSTFFFACAALILINTAPLARADTVVKLPNQYNPNTKWPVVILLHGAGATGNMQDLHFGLSERVSTKGFILATPEATTDSDTSVRTNSDILRLIDDLTTSYSVDNGRIYLFGQSMGGFAAQRFACDHGDTIAGIVVSSAYGTCKTPVAPVSVFLTTGDADISHQKVAEFTNSWLRNNGCADTAATTSDLDLQWDVFGAESSATIWENCRKNTSVISLRAKFGRHVPIFRAGFTTFVLDQLLAPPNQKHKSIADAHEARLNKMKISGCFSQDDDRGRFLSSKFSSSRTQTQLEIAEHQSPACDTPAAKITYSGPAAKTMAGRLYGLKLDQVAIESSSDPITSDLNGKTGQKGFCGNSWQSHVAFEAKGNNLGLRRLCIASMGSHLGAAALAKRLILSYAFSPPLP